MAKTKRNVGQEILDGIRQIKRGEHGRITNVPSVSSVRIEDWPFAVEVCHLAWRIGPNAAGVGTRPTCTIWCGQDPPADCGKESAGVD